MPAPSQPIFLPPELEPSIRLVGVWRPYVAHSPPPAPIPHADPVATAPIITAEWNLYGGFIINPATAFDQNVRGHAVPVTHVKLVGPVNTYWPNYPGLPLNTAKWVDYGDPTGDWVAEEALYVSLVGPADLEDNDATTMLLPGAIFNVPPGASVWVNAVTDGHRFTAVFGRDQAQATPDPVPQTGFPPNGVTGLTHVMYAYLYQEYSDDDDLQAFVAILNSMQLDYVDTFNGIQLPIYPNALISGALADWVMMGIYGWPRPVFSTSKTQLIGPLNTYWPNYLGLPLNTIKHVEPLGATLISDDDTYKRSLTWHFQKGDGKYFNVRWLKRRIMRFLIGVDGTCPHVDNTDRISITFDGEHATIRIINSETVVTGGTICNMFGPNGLMPGAPPTIPGLPRSPPTLVGPIPPNTLIATFEQYPPFDHASVLQEALWAGVLELPFQFNWDIVIN